MKYGLYKYLALLVIALALTFKLWASMEQLSASEEELKAAYIEKFCRFVTWPDSTFENTSSIPFVIGIYHDEIFADKLSRIYKAQKIKGKKVNVVSIVTAGQAKECNLLYISTTANGELEQVLKATEKLPILTVSHTPGYAERGVQINMYRTGNRLRFEINPAAVKLAGLSMSRLLLNSARIVE